MDVLEKSPLLMLINNLQSAEHLCECKVYLSRMNKAMPQLVRIYAFQVYSEES